MTQWYTKTSAQTLTDLDTDPNRGLTSTQAAQRLAQYGPNRLEKPKPTPLILRFLLQLKDPMILVLLAAAVLSLLSTGGEDWIEAVIILLIVVVNAVISITQENSAHKALEALEQMSAPLAKVVRDGQTLRLDTRQLVPGDIVLLEAGDLVPADGRILHSSNLKADESAITGESVPVSKEAGARLAADTDLADQTNMVISSTVITNGRATCVVTATGMDTQVGRIAGMLLEQEDPSTPLQRKMGEISRTLSFACLGVCAVMFGIGLLYHIPLLEMFLTAVALAVAAIPEGLPAIVTIVLALGVQRMARRHAIVKKLPAVETLGCAGVICSDKTGTLTMNRMTVVQIWTAREQHRLEALIVGALCNDATLNHDSDGVPHLLGDPTETALVDAALTIRRLALVSQLVVKLAAARDEAQVQFSLGRAELEQRLESQSAAMRSIYNQQIARLEELSRSFRRKYADMHLTSRYASLTEDLKATAAAARSELLKKRAERKQKSKKS